MPTPVVPVALIIILIGLLGYLIVRVIKGDKTSDDLPWLSEVGKTASGVLACPVCGCASFLAAGSRGFFAIALGPFVFGSMNSSSKNWVECASCYAQFRRGLPARDRLLTS